MDFQLFLDDIKSSILILVKNSAKDLAQQVAEDAKDLLKETEQDLKRWTVALAENKLTRDEFEFLLGMRADNAKMHALTQIGISKLRVQRVRDALVSIIVKSTLKLIG